MNPDRLDLKVVWTITSIVSAATAFGGYALGKAVDCKPGQVDGQCGLSTFLGLLLGAGTGLALLIILAVCSIVILFRRRRISRQRPK